MQQSVSRVLGVLDYNAHPHGLQDVMQYLLNCVNKEVCNDTVFRIHCFTERGSYRD